MYPDMKEKLDQLVARCRGSVSIDINDHRGESTLEEYVKQHVNYGGRIRSEVSAEVYDEMIKRDTLITVHFYPISVGGFNVVFHYDLESALDAALDTLRD